MLHLMVNAYREAPEFEIPRRDDAYGLWQRSIDTFLGAACPSGKAVPQPAASGPGRKGPGQKQHQDSLLKGGTDASS
jgi:hypothetical protein